MDYSVVRKEIEKELIGNSNRKRHPMGLPITHNMRESRVYLYDTQHLTGYTDMLDLIPIFEEKLNESELSKGSTPVTYLVENDKNVVQLKLTEWNHSVSFQNIKCDSVIKLTKVSNCVFIKYEFHIRVVN